MSEAIEVDRCRLRDDVVSITKRLRLGCFVIDRDSSIGNGDC